MAETSAAQRVAPQQLLLMAKSTVPREWEPGWVRKVAPLWWAQQKAREFLVRLQSGASDQPDRGSHAAALAHEGR